MLTEADIAMSDTGKIRKIAERIEAIECRLDSRAMDLPEKLLRTWNKISKVESLMTELSAEMRLMRACWPGKEWHEAWSRLLAEKEELKTEIARLRKRWVDG